MTTLVESMGAIGDTVIVVGFVLLIFAVAGVQVIKILIINKLLINSLDVDWSNAKKMC